MNVYSWLSIPTVLTLSCIAIAPVTAGLFDRPDFFEQGHDQFEEEITFVARNVNECNIIDSSGRRLILSFFEKKAMKWYKK